MRVLWLDQRMDWVLCILILALPIIELLTLAPPSAEVGAFHHFCGRNTEMSNLRQERMALTHH